MTAKRDSLGRRRAPNQERGLLRPALQGRVNRSHSVNAAPSVHESFARLTPQQRGDLIERALRDA